MGILLLSPAGRIGDEERAVDTLDRSPVQVLEQIVQGSLRRRPVVSN